ncbi:hypothetical protein BC941DRAFT_414778 [Chlamydoabsidia padenii]|nr:hypothetical protein BC941DRAFT_414778 [Chlamydoabsidia padenii]
MFLQCCLISITGILFQLAPFVSTLPVPNGYHHELDATTIKFANKLIDHSPSSVMPLTNDFDVDLNRFTQLLSAHIMTEHLDIAITALSKKLAGQIQDSMQLDIYQPVDTIQPNYYNYYFETTNTRTTTDEVDIRLLKEQLQGAVGSFVEDQLPALWYSHRSFVPLDSVSLRSFMELTLLAHCPTSQRISYQCLQPTDFATTLDTYVKQNMQSTLTDIVQQDLPQLVIMTDNHVQAILNHFNTFLLPPHTQLRVKRLSAQDWSSMGDTVNTVLDSIDKVENKHGVVHSIRRYALLAKSTT